VDFTVDDAVRRTGQRPARARVKRLRRLCDQVLTGEVLLEELAPEIDAFTTAVNQGLNRLRRDAAQRPGDAVFEHVIETYERMLAAADSMRRVFETIDEAYLRDGMAAVEAIAAEVETVLEQARDCEARAREESGRTDDPLAEPG